MANFNPFKPAQSSIDPTMFLGSQSTQAPMSDEEKLDQYLESQGIKPKATTPAEAGGSSEIGGTAALAGARAIAGIAQEIGKAQQFKAQQQQDIISGQGQSQQRALGQSGASKFKSLAELIQNYRASMR